MVLHNSGIRHIELNHDGIRSKINPSNPKAGSKRDGLCKRIQWSNLRNVGFYRPKLLEWYNDTISVIYLEHRCHPAVNKECLPGRIGTGIRSKVDQSAVQFSFLAEPLPALLARAPSVRPSRRRLLLPMRFFLTDQNKLTFFSLLFTFSPVRYIPCKILSHAGSCAVKYLHFIFII